MKIGQEPLKVKQGSGEPLVHLTADQWVLVDEYLREAADSEEETANECRVNDETDEAVTYKEQADALRGVIAKLTEQLT